VSENKIRINRDCGGSSLPPRAAVVAMKPSTPPSLGWMRRTDVTPRASVRPHGTGLESRMRPKPLTMRPNHPGSERRRAIELFQAWDQVMQKHHGTLYHRRLGYSLH
jgi:hypothetical protein